MYRGYWLAVWFIIGCAIYDSFRYVFGPLVIFYIINGVGIRETAGKRGNANLERDAFQAQGKSGTPKPIGPCWKAMGLGSTNNGIWSSASSHFLGRRSYAQLNGCPAPDFVDPSRWALTLCNPSLWAASSRVRCSQAPSRCSMTR